MQPKKMNIGVNLKFVVIRRRAIGKGNKWEMQNAECRMQNAECKMQNAECKMQNAKKGQGHGLTSSFAEASTFAEPTADRTADRESRPALPCPAQPRLICSSRHHFFDKVSRAHCKNCPAAAVSP
jgi:hypothetical protein